MRPLRSSAVWTSLRVGAGVRNRPDRGDDQTLTARVRGHRIETAEDFHLLAGVAPQLGGITAERIRGTRARRTDRARRTTGAGGLCLAQHETLDGGRIRGRWVCAARRAD